MDGATLSGIGTFLIGTMAVATFVLGFINRHRIEDWFADRTIIIGQRDAAQNEAQRQGAVRQAAEASAEIWEDAARGAMFDAQSMEKRLGIVEGQMSNMQQANANLREEQNRLRARVQQSDELASEIIRYARELLDWSVKAEAVAQLGGLTLGPIPPVPSSLADRLKVPAVLAE